MYHLIVNPTAGKGKAARAVDDIKEIFDREGVQCTFYETTEPGHATTIARDLLEKGAKTIVAVGGDGTIAEVAKPLIGTDVALGIIPAGTGNDYRTSMGIPDDIEGAIDYLLTGSPIASDAFEVNGDRYLNIASVGFDVDVVRRAVHYKFLGSAAYTLGAIEGAFFAKNIEVTVSIDGEVFDKNLLLAAVGCGTHYGGGMNAMPKADIGDGLLDVCLIDATGTMEILRLLPQYVKGAHETFDIVTMYRAKEVTIKLKNEQLPINADGEILPACDRLHVKILPGQINIIRI